jgi:hypothetical protein
MSDCNDIPAPGQVPFEADEVLIYGIRLNGGVASVQVTNGGSGYTSVPSVKFEGGGGRRAAATAVLTSQVVTSINVTDPGFGYLTPPKATVEGGGGTGAVLATTLATTAILNLDGNWDVRIEGVPASGTPNFNIVAAYGYAYEGHCYRFDRPRILGFGGRTGEPAVGCGYDIPTALGYAMWRTKSNRRIIEFTAAVDNVDKIILEANLPGRRPPNTYSANMMLAHRGGRLTS